MKTQVLYLGTHVLALAVGWAAYRSTVITGAPAQPAAPPPREIRPERNRLDEATRQRLISELRERWRDERPTASPPIAPGRSHGDVMKAMRDGMKAQKERDAAELERILQRSQGIVLPSDPAAELERLRNEHDTIQYMATILAWLRLDPQAALPYLDANPGAASAPSFASVVKTWFTEIGSTEALALLKHAPTLDVRLSLMVVNLTALTDPTALAAIIQSMEGRIDRQTILRGAFDDLPEAKRKPVLDWIVHNLKGREAGSSIMSAAISLARTEPAEAKSFLKDALALNLDPATIQTLRGWGNFQDIMRTGVGPDSPIDERIEAMLHSSIRGKTEEERRANARNAIISQDTDRWLEEGSWAHSVRNESATVDDAWSAMTARFPEFATGDREVMLKTAFSILALSDPKGALALLSREGEDTKSADYVLQTVGNSMHRDLEAAMELVEMLPDNAVRARMEKYDSLYDTLAEYNASSRGKFWADWIREQPAGLNRDLLLRHTADYYFKTGNETEGTALRVMIGDPAIKARPQPDPARP